MHRRLGNRGGPLAPEALRVAAPDPIYANRQVHSWRVLHASDVTSPLAALVSGQLEIGMRPEVLTHSGSIHSADISSVFAQQGIEKRPSSLIDLWRHSRTWERLIRDAAREGDYEVIHGHSLAAAFAAAHRSVPVVYDVEHFPANVFPHVRDEAEFRGNSLASRALRSAQQFMFNRAVIVSHRNSVREDLIARGADPNRVFLVPEAFFVASPPEPDTQRLRALGIKSRGSTLLFAPAWKLEIDAYGELTPASRTLLEVFNAVISEVDVDQCDVHFLAEFSLPARAAVAEWSTALGIASRLHLISAREQHIAEVSSDIIIASDLAAVEIRSALNPFALRALLHRKALLAADVDCNRDLTPEGRGCLWYSHKSPRDLARRAAFLVRNPDFRRVLAAGGHNYLRESRDPVTVATKYDAIYRQAFSRNARGRIAPPLARLAPVQMVA